MTSDEGRVGRLSSGTAGAAAPLLPGESTSAIIDRIRAGRGASGAGGAGGAVS
jgi:hypothetical protein